MNRTTLTKLHLILAAFMFPAVLMFLVTGGLYTWGNKGEWHEQSVEIALDSPLTADELTLRSIALAELNRQGILAPSGKASVSGEGSDATLNWTGARTEVTLQAGDQPLTANATIRQASMHRWLVQLHKAKGSTAFKVYATFLASVLFLLVASGLVMGIQVKSMRRMTLLSGVAGLATFVGFVIAG